MKGSRSLAGWAVLVAGIFCGVVGGTFLLGHRLVGQLAPTAAVLVLASFALLSSLVLSGVLGAVGVWKTKLWRIGGAGGVFVIVFSTLLGGYQVMNGTSLMIVGRVAEVPRQKRVIVKCGDCEETADSGGRFKLNLSKECEAEIDRCQIAVEGYLSQTQSLRSLLGHSGDTVTWKRERTSVRGTVHYEDGRVVQGATVGLVCASGEDPMPQHCDEGTFRIADLDSLCANPPFKVVIRAEGKERHITWEKPDPIEITLPVPLPTVRAVDRKEQGVFGVELDRPPDGVADVYGAESGIYVPARERPMAGIVISSKDEKPWKVGDRASLVPLSGMSLKERVVALKDAPDNALEKASEIMPDTREVRELLVARYLKNAERIGAEALTAHNKCADLRKVGELLKKARKMASTDQRVATALIELKSKEDLFCE